MGVTVHIPTPLRPFLDNQSTVELEIDGSVSDVLRELVNRGPELGKHLFDESGKLRHFVNIYVNDEDIRYRGGDAAAVAGGDTISIVPSIAGGALTGEELVRYSRHIVIPEVGQAGQEKLKEGSALLIGAGGLGSPMALYLAAAGVGRIGIVEFDTVDASNLQRQVLYGTSMIGQSKLEAAKKRLLDLNPYIQVDTHPQPLSSDNALGIFKDYDVVADGTDNFPTRYLVNDACVLTGKPNVYGSIFRFEGQISVFNYQGGPCYRCLYAEPPPPGLVPNCAEGGVFGVLPGIIGSLQAAEVIKVLMGLGDVAAGRLLMFDALALKFRELKLRRNPNCPVCGDHPTVTQLIDYEQFCGMLSNGQAPIDSTVTEISVQELKQKLDRKEDVVLLDVREPFEFEISRFEKALLIPLGELPNRLRELDTGKHYVVHCKVGGRSAKAVKLMKEKGFRDAVNLAGGINAWAKEIDPSMRSY